MQVIKVYVLIVFRKKQFKIYIKWQCIDYEWNIVKIILSNEEPAI